MGGAVSSNEFPQVANPLTARMGKGVNTTMDEGQTMIPISFNARQDPDSSEGVSGPLDADGYTQAVRRLMPIECERLQGVPDNFTLIPYRGKLAADGPRYKVLGNMQSINVMRWIGWRIKLVSEIE